MTVMTGAGTIMLPVRPIPVNKIFHLQGFSSDLPQTDIGDVITWVHLPVELKQEFIRIWWSKFAAVSKTRFVAISQDFIC